MTTEVKTSVLVSVSKVELNLCNVNTSNGNIIYYQPTFVAQLGVVLTAQNVVVKEYAAKNNLQNKGPSLLLFA